ncbi:hypothetical protein Tco_0469165 [Tanacetum coccineum]
MLRFRQNVSQERKEQQQDAVYKLLRELISFHECLCMRLENRDEREQQAGPVFYVAEHLKILLYDIVILYLEHTEILLISYVTKLYNVYEDMVFKEFDAKNPELVDEEKEAVEEGKPCTYVAEVIWNSFNSARVLCSFVLPDHKPFRTIATSLFYVSSLEALCKTLDDYYKEKCARLIALQPLLIDREQPTCHKVDGSCLAWEDP